MTKTTSQRKKEKDCGQDQKTVLYKWRKRKQKFFYLMALFYAYEAIINEEL